MPAKPGDLVRLERAHAGMPSGSEGVLIGWYTGDHPEALVRFWDGGPLRVPVDSIVEVGRQEPSGPRHLIP